MKGIWIFFGEWIVAFVLGAIIYALLRKSAARKYALFLSAFFFFLAFLGLQQPCRPEGKLTIVAKETFGSRDFVIGQVHDAFTLNFLWFATRERGKGWRRYYLQHEAPNWLSAKLSLVGNNVVVKRLGVRVATFSVLDETLELHFIENTVHQSFDDNELSELADQNF